MFLPKFSETGGAVEMHVLPSSRILSVQGCDAHSDSEDDSVPTKITRLVLHFHYWQEDDAYSTEVCYYPVTVNDACQEIALNDLLGQIKIPHSQIDSRLRAKLERMRDY